MAKRAVVDRGQLRGSMLGNRDFEIFAFERM